MIDKGGRRGERFPPLFCGIIDPSRVFCTMVIRLIRAAWDEPCRKARFILGQLRGNSAADINIGSVGEVQTVNQNFIVGHSASISSSGSNRKHTIQEYHM